MGPDGPSGFLCASEGGHRQRRIDGGISGWLLDSASYYKTLGVFMNETGCCPQILLCM